MQSNAHLGSGILSGTAAGIETDENGNIVGLIRKTLCWDS